MELRYKFHSTIIEVNKITLHMREKNIVNQEKLKRFLKRIRKIIIYFPILFTL